MIEWHKPEQFQQEIRSLGFRERWKSDRSLCGKFIYSSSQSWAYTWKQKCQGKTRKRILCATSKVCPIKVCASSPAKFSTTVPEESRKWILYHPQLRNKKEQSAPGPDRRATTRICLNTGPQWLKGKQGKQLQLLRAITVLNCWTLDLDSNYDFQSAFFSNLLFPIFSETIGNLQVK